MSLFFIARSRGAISLKKVYMIITPLGGPAVKIISKTSLVPEGELSIVVNPYSQVKGLPKLRKQNAHIIVASKEDSAYCDDKNFSKEAFVITTPGEYEIKGVLIGAEYVGTEKERTLIFRMDIENVALGFCIGLSSVDMTAIESTLEGIDVLFISVGGKGLIDSKKAMDVVAELEPRMVIPMEYKSKASPVARDDISAFSKEFGTTKPVVSSKFKLTKKDLPTTDRQLLLLE